MSAEKHDKAVRVRALNQRLLKLRREHPVVFNLIALGIAVLLVALWRLVEWSLR
jgi:hypothetical protein